MPHFQTLDGLRYTYQGTGLNLEKPDTFEFADKIGDSKDPTPQEPASGQTAKPEPNAPGAGDTFFYADPNEAPFDPPQTTPDDDFVI